jgi:Integrase core domain/Winged helix-turn helix
MDDFAQLKLTFVDHIQWRYEVIRPVVLLQDTTPQQRAHETHTHPFTVRRLVRQFQERGMIGLLPGHVEGVGRTGAPRVPEAIRQEIYHLKALYEGLHYRELSRILFIKFGHPIDHKTVKAIWQESPVSMQGRLERLDYHSHPDRYQARLAIVKLHYQGWDKVSISQFLKVSRPTLDAILKRFAQEHFAGLVDKKRGPKEPRRKILLPLMVQVYHLQKAHPDAGEFRLWSLLNRQDVSVRTVGRIMALNRLVYGDIPHVPKKGPKRPPQAHPFKASHPHEYWFIDGRPMDFTMHGVRWWSLLILDGYSRAMLAGAVAPEEATWVALMVLYTACAQEGVPEHLVSDGGGAYTSNAFEAVCERLQIDHQTIASREGESWKNLIETHFNIQRRLYDYRFSFAKTPLEFERLHEAFIQTYNTTAHQGLLKEGFRPPIPLRVLGGATGRVYTAEELRRKFIHYLFPRTTNTQGCVTLHSYYFYVEEGLPQQQVLLWVSGDTLRAEYERVVLAEYRCRYNWQERKVKDIHHPVLHQTRFASEQGELLPWSEREWLVVYRPRRTRRKPRLSPLTQQLLLFESA